MHAETRVTNQY